METHKLKLTNPYYSCCLFCFYYCSEGFIVFGNSFTGTIPTEIGLMGSLSKYNIVLDSQSRLCRYEKRNYLSFSVNSITHSLTHSHQYPLLCLCFPPYSVGFDITGNAINGPIPSEIGNAANLGFFQVSNNLLSGAIPEEMGYPRFMRVFDVSNNQLTGVLPLSFSNWTDPAVFRVAFNPLSPDDIPAYLYDMTQLVDLQLQDAGFNASISGPGVANWAGMRILNLGLNTLTGPFPAEIVTLTDLEQFIVIGNSFTGQLPAGISQLDKLSE